MFVLGVENPHKHTYPYPQRHDNIWAVVLIFSVLHSAFGTYLLTSVFQPVYQGNGGSGGNGRRQQTANQSAAAVLGILPALIFFIIFQWTLTSGITMGAVK